MSVPPEHARVLPHVNISEQGLRELELWLRTLQRAAGSGWRFNVFNGDDGETQHGWGWLQTDDSTDHGYGELGFLIVDKSEQGITILAIDAANTTQSAITISYDGGISLGTTSGANAAFFANGAITISQKANSTWQIMDSSETLIIKDSAGNPLVTYTG